MNKKNRAKAKETYIVCGGGKSHIGRKISVAPTILARIYKGFDTYGIPAVIEYERKCKNDSGSHAAKRN